MMKKGIEEPADDELVFGNDRDFWKYTKRNGFNLTRSRQASSSAIYLETTTTPVLIDPLRCALMIIDMQNFFLHPSIRSHQSGLAAYTQLLNHAIPAARKINMQILWLNWGLTQDDIDRAPPGLKCVFGFDRINDSTNHSEPKGKKIYRGFGMDMGEIALGEGEKVDGGKLLMRDTWNTQLYGPLQESYLKSQQSCKPDRWFHKNRTSGLWTDQSPLLTYLHENQFTTLLFAGVNTDQCVSGTLQDAFNKGFDCLLLRDGCGTTSPPFAQQTVEYNCARGSGFLVDCETFAKNIDAFLVRG